MWKKNIYLFHKIPTNPWFAHWIVLTLIFIFLSLKSGSGWSRRVSPKFSSRRLQRKDENTEKMGFRCIDVVYSLIGHANHRVKNVWLTDRDQYFVTSTADKYQPKLEPLVHIFGGNSRTRKKETLWMQSLFTFCLERIEENHFGA